MADAGSGELVKLTISAEDNSSKFEVMLNPEKFTHNLSINYNTKEGKGKSETEAKFNAYRPQNVSFNIWIDGTGVVNPGKGSPDVRTQIKQLKDVVYKYNGQKHEPNDIKLLWGSFIFFGRLKTMEVEYTLFKPSGEPLRANVGLAFVGSVSSEEESARAQRNSPDLTHIVEVKAGDTLPLLCYRTYKDCSYYAEVAKVNNIVNFRSLEPGRRLEFPPLR